MSQYFQKVCVPANTVLSGYPVYEGNDMGCVVSKMEILFRLWSPPASDASVLLYHNDGDAGASPEVVPMHRGESGTWVALIKCATRQRCYTYQVTIDNLLSREVIDPYARAISTNGKWAMIVDPAAANPAGWEQEESPGFSSPTDAIIYEAHVRDLSMHPGSGIGHKGKFAGVAATGAFNRQGFSTGLDHIKELGVTHLHLLPLADFNGRDSSGSVQLAYNWGYNPVHYNIPEGSYCTHPTDGLSRIRELKQLVMTAHRNGLRIVVDVVYNHTADAAASAFHQLVPGYYFRHCSNGTFSNASGCGNETASERPMMRRFMIDSLLYWVNEFHVDGFRFDLMGIHDITTMKAIAHALNAVRPNLLLYGEGWTAAPSPLPHARRAIKQHVAQLEGIAVFCDELRDGIKGSVFETSARGFVAGNSGLAASVRFGIVGACAHPQVDTAALMYSTGNYATAPGQVVNYCECHDNHTLFDKLRLSNAGSCEAVIKKMQQLALTIVLTAQGIPFLHAGGEMLRTKQGIENSYHSGDAVNAIDWDLKSKHHDLCHYVASLTRMRKLHPVFRMTTTQQIKDHIEFDDSAPEGTIAYLLDGEPLGDPWKRTWVAFNGTGMQQSFVLPPGNWKWGLLPVYGAVPVQGLIKVEAHGAAILYLD